MTLDCRSLSRFEYLEVGPGSMEKPLIVIDFYSSPGLPSTRGVGDQHTGAKRIGSDDGRSFLKTDPFSGPFFAVLSLTKYIAICYISYNKSQ
jgi:hypothetical protein